MMRARSLLAGSGLGVSVWAALWLVQRELVAPSVEFVAAILQPVWPRDQYLTPARGAHFVGSVSVDKLPAAHRIGANSATNLDDHYLLISGCDRNLLTRWCDHRCLQLTQFERPGHRTLGVGDQLCFAPMDKDSEDDDRDQGDND